MDSVRGVANIRRRAVALREQRQRLRERQQEEGVVSRGEELGDMELELEVCYPIQWNLLKRMCHYGEAVLSSEVLFWSGLYWRVHSTVP